MKVPRPSYMHCTHWCYLCTTVLQNTLGHASPAAAAAAAAQVFMTITTMLCATDCPDGNYVDLKASGVMKKQSNGAMWRAAVTNYRWVDQV
jgi:hypothetical protein